MCNLVRHGERVKSIDGEVGKGSPQQFGTVLKVAYPYIAVGTEQTAYRPGVVVVIHPERLPFGVCRQFATDTARTTLGHRHLVVFGRSDPVQVNPSPLSELLLVGLIVRSFPLREDFPVSFAVRPEVFESLLPIGLVVDPLLRHDLLAVSRMVRLLLLCELLAIGLAVGSVVCPLRCSALVARRDFLSPVLLVPGAGAMVYRHATMLLPTWPITP